MRTYSFVFHAGRVFGPHPHAVGASSSSPQQMLPAEFFAIDAPVGTLQIKL